MPVLSRDSLQWAITHPYPPRKGCALSPPISRSVIGSTTDFGSVSFGSIPDGKTFYWIKKGSGMLVAIMIMVVLNTLFTMACVGHLSSIEKLLTVLAQAKIDEIKMWSNSGGK